MLRWCWHYLQSAWNLRKLPNSLELWLRALILRTGELYDRASKRVRS